MCVQVSKEIRKWLIKLCTLYIPPTMIHKITPVEYNCCLKRSDTQLKEPANQNPIKVTKVVMPTKKKTLL